MNKYELYEKNKHRKGLELCGHCFIADGELFVYTLVGNGELIEEAELGKSYKGDVRLINVNDGVRWDDNNWVDRSVEDIVNKIEEHWDNLYDSVVYIGKPHFDMNLEGFDFVTLNVNYEGMEERD